MADEPLAEDPPAPTPPAGPEQEAVLPADLGFWRAKVKESDARLEQYKDLWQTNRERHQPPPAQLKTSTNRYDVNPNIDYTQVEQKKALLLFDRPEMVLTSETPLGDDPALQDAVVVHTAVLNQKLGPKPHGVDVKRVGQLCLTDALAISGFGWSIIGYSNVSVPVEVDVPDETKPPTVEAGPDGMPQLVPAMKKQTVRVPLKETCFWSHASVGKAIIPADATTADSDDWPYAGTKFSMPRAVALREFNLPADFEGTVSKDPSLIDPDADSQRKAPTKLVTGQWLWYYAAQFDEREAHPDKVRELVLIDGLDDRPARHRDSPYQTFGPDNRLTADSMEGLPVQPMILGDAPDQPFPLSDSSMTRNLADQYAVYIGQSIKHRDAATSIIMYRPSALSQEQREDLEQKGYFHFWGIEDEAMWPPGSPPVIAVPMSAVPRDNYEGAALIRRLIESTLAIGTNQSGLANTGKRSATEIATVQGNTDVRMEAIRLRVVDWLIRGTRKLDALLQRYSDSAQWVSVLGETGVRRWAQWDKHTIAGRFLYSIRPDSQLKTDAATDRNQLMQLYSFVAKDPSWNRAELNRRLAGAFGMDPAKAIAPPQPAGPPPPNVAVKVAMADLYSPAGPIAIKILQQAGYQIDPADVQTMMLAVTALPPKPDGAAKLTDPAPDGNPPHGGPADRMEQLDAHQQRRTGGIEGVGVVPGA